MNDGPHSPKAQDCRLDFWFKLQEAMRATQGYIPLSKLAEMKLKDIIELLAQNGIRMTYSDK